MIQQSKANSNSIRSPRTPTLPQPTQQQIQQSPKQTPVQEFRKKKFKQFFFRNYKASTEPGIVIFLLKQINQEILENLIFEIFRKFYKGIILPNFLYFDSQKKVIKFRQIKPECINYFYITESDIDQNSSMDIRYSEQQQPNFFSTIDEQKNNLDLFILKETEYLDFLNGNVQIHNIQQSYAQLQFFLERCYQDVWSHLEDFAKVSHQRRVRLAQVADTVDKKREEIHEIAQLMQTILSQFEEQESQVRFLCQKMGFDDDFIDKTVTLQERQSQRLSYMQSIKDNNNYYQMQQQNIDDQEGIMLNGIPDSPESDYRLELFLPKNAKDV